MLDVKFGNILHPIVKTSDFGGLSNEDLAEVCAQRILHVADSAPPAIREQAKFFQDHLRKILLDFLGRASSSERAKCIQICANGGFEQAAHLLRRE